MGLARLFGAFFTGNMGALRFFMNLVLDPLVTKGERRLIGASPTV